MLDGMKAILVGAGIGGPVLALWLQKVGIEVALVEARPCLAAEGAFLGLAPNGLHALAPLGLAPRIAARGHACERFEFANRKGRTIGAIDRRHDLASFGHALTMIRRSDLHEELAAACEERGLRIAFGRKLEAIEQHATHVLVRFEDGTTERADVVVGCDGMRSATRARAMPDAPQPTFSGLLDFGGFTRVPDLPLPVGVNVMVFGARAFFGVFRTPNDEVWWFHNGPPTDDALDVEQQRARLLALHADDPVWVRQIIERTDDVLGPWKIHDLVAMPRWSSGRVCLLGDAAHAMSPSAGQGASMAMEDALVLAQCLRDLKDPVVAFTTFERLRRPRVDAIFKAARRNSINKALSPIGAWFRDRLLPRFLPSAAREQSASYAWRVDWEERIRAVGP